MTDNLYHQLVWIAKHQGRGLVAQTFNPSLAGLCEFEVGQVYVVSSQTATDSERTPVLLERERNPKAKMRQTFRPFQKG